MPAEEPRGNVTEGVRCELGGTLSCMADIVEIWDRRLRTAREWRSGLAGILEVHASQIASAIHTDWRSEEHRVGHTEGGQRERVTSRNGPHDHCRVSPLATQASDDMPQFVEHATPRFDRHLN